MLILRPDQIAAAMNLFPLPSTFPELDAMVARGIPKTALRTIVSRVAAPEERAVLLHRIVPEGTFKRRNDVLSAEESQRTERVARVYATAAHVLESEEDARAFLNKGHPMLEDRSPLEVAFTEIGARRVERLLRLGISGFLTSD